MEPGFRGGKAAFNRKKHPSVLQFVRKTEQKYLFWLALEPR